MLFAMLLALAPAEANLATCAPREPPATGRCCYGFPAPSALQGCFLNLPTEAFDEAFSSSGLLTTEPCATVTTMPCPTPRPAVRRRRWRSTRPRTSSTSGRQRCAYLPPDLCPSASLTGAMQGPCRAQGPCWSVMQSSDYNDVVAGCTRGNAMLCSLGAGTCTGSFFFTNLR